MSERVRRIPSARKLRRAMIDNNRANLPDRNCPVCGYLWLYHRDGKQLYYDQRCYCATQGRYYPVSWKTLRRDLRDNHTVESANTLLCFIGAK